MKKKGILKWVIIAVVVFGIIGMVAGGGSDSSDNAKKVGNTKNDTDQKDTSKKAKKSSKTNYYPGDVIEFGDFKINYISLKTYKSKNEFIKPKDGNKFIQYSFKFKNNGESDNYPGDFSCYYKNNKYDQAYTVEGSNDFLLEQLSPGRELKGKIYYEVPKKAKLKDIELEYENNSIWSEKKIIFMGK